MITTAPAARAAAHALFGTLLLWSSSLSAQNLHIHDASSAAAAKDAKAAFEEAAKGDADVFDLMIANVRALESKTLGELYALNQQTVRTTANGIPAWGWDKLTCDLRTREKDFLEAYRQALSIQGQAVSRIGTAKEAVEFATKALAAKKDELDKRTKELNQKAPDVKTLRESIDKVRTAITMQPEAPKNLKDLPEFQALIQKDWTGLKAVHDWFAQVAESSGGPGLQLSMLDLALELQKGEVDRLRLEVDRLTDELAYAQRVSDLLTMIFYDGTTTPDPKIDTRAERLKGGEFSTMYTTFEKYLPDLPSPQTKGYCEAGFKDGSPSVVIQTLGRLAKEAENEVGESPVKTLELKNTLTALATDVAIAGYQKYLLMEAMFQHTTNELVHSIQSDALNARMRATLIAHGLEALNTYHQGGITGTDVANVISAAQAIAMAVIAGKVN